MAKINLTITFKVWDCWLEDNYKGSPTIHILVEFLNKLHLWSKKDKDIWG